jgi:hypothetical protein
MQSTTEIQRRGFSINIFLPEGTPTGLKLVEKSNWTGLGVVCPRPRFTTMKQRDDFQKPGVYVLTGPSETPDLPQAYIGEGDPVRTRLEDHHANRDFWTVAHFFTSKDSHLNKAHIEHLEHRLIHLADAAKHCTLENLNFPSPPSLSESELAFAETFLEEVLLCFPIVGLNIFEKPMLKAQIRQFLILTNKGISAEGYESEDGFVVKKGSTAVVETVSSAHAFSISLRKELLKNGILKQQSARFLEFAEDYEFSSPSTAAAVLVGASANGRDFWKTRDGITLKELQAKAEDI